MVGNKTTRRGALKVIGAVAVGAGVSTGATSARNRREASKPVIANGTRIIRRVPTDDGYRREETFEVESTTPLSLGVKDESVTATTRQQGSNQAVESTESIDLGTDEFELDEQEIATRITTQRDSEISVNAADVDITPDRDPEVIEYEDTAILGTVKQHYDQEMRVRDELLSSDSVEATAASNPLLSSDCSKYTYNGDNPSDKDDLAERTAPINLAWDNGKDASEIKSDMAEWGWGAPWPSGSKYIFEKSYSVKKQDEHIQKNIFPYYAPNQWHVRAYDLSYADDMEVVGAGHKDPIDHNQTCEIIGVTCGVDWKFKETRRKASDKWNDVRSIWGANADADSSRGLYDYIEGDIEEKDSSCSWCIPLSEEPKS